MLSALLLVAGCSGAPAPTLSPSESASPTPTPILDLYVGSCTMYLDFGAPQAGLKEMPCDEPHYYEVTGVTKLDMEEYPGEESFSAWATGVCDTDFQAYVGTIPAYTRYVSAYVGPNEEDWEQVEEDRVLVCLVGVADGMIETTARGDTRVFPEVGECTGPQNVSPLELEIIDCAEPHYYEVYASARISGDYPNSERLDKLIDDVCAAGFKKFVGLSSPESKYTYTWFVPSEAEWEELLDHRIVCSAGLDKGGITGTLKGVKK